MIEFRLTGKATGADTAPAQTIFSAFAPGSIASVWVGLRGPRQTLAVILGRDPGRSPSYWLGPDVLAGSDFDIHVAFYPDMGPGGVLYRHHDDPRWSSFTSATAKGPELISWPPEWSVGQGQGGPGDRPFRGAALSLQIAKTEG
jgi:hypothetical protein